MSNIVRQLSVHKEHEVLLKLESAGLNDDLAQKIIDSKDNDLAAKVVMLIRNGGFEPSTSQKRARKVMGKNYFGVEEAIKHFGVNPSKMQIAALSDVPFSEETLEECKNTHILVAVFPLSILDIRGKVERKLFYSHEDAWYNGQIFAQDHGEVSWQLVRKTPIANSTSKNWPEQQALLAKNEETPTSRVMVYTIIGHCLATGERLFENVHVQCLDISIQTGYRVYVGGFDGDGLRVSGRWVVNRSGCLGLASSRKFQ